MLMYLNKNCKGQNFQKALQDLEIEHFHTAVNWDMDVIKTCVVVLFAQHSAVSGVFSYMHLYSSSSTSS